MKRRRVKWVPHFLDDDLRAKRLEGARQFLDVPQAQERCHFRDIITEDETCICLDMKPIDSIKSAGATKVGPIPPLVSNLEFQLIIESAKYENASQIKAFSAITIVSEI
jgi:hypothetical protein